MAHFKIWWISTIEPHRRVCCCSPISRISTSAALETVEGANPDRRAAAARLMELDARSARKLPSFDPDHHVTLREAYEDKRRWWHEETEVQRTRCKTCWLRDYQCHCASLMATRASYAHLLPTSATVLLYYTSAEIGRTANTAHLFEAICPQLVESLVYGDLTRERQLVQEIEDEYRAGCLRTCIMFPCNGAQLLSTWMQKRTAAAEAAAVAAGVGAGVVMGEAGAGAGIGKDGTVGGMEGTLGPLRLVMLDGTFPGAAKEARYLIQCLQLRGVPAPVVKLDLESGVCKSAVAGLMYQPREDTICTFQAIVMALQQAGCGAAFCHSLTQHLQDWITHLLVHCVKQGKSREKRCNKGIVDTTPTDFLIKAIKTRDELRVARVTEKHTLWLERLSMQELARATRLFALTHTKKFSVADFLYT